MRTDPKARKPAAELTRSELLEMLHTYVRGRPGFDPLNYGDAASYRADQRTAQRQLHDAEAMLAAIGWRVSIDADAIRNALQGSGRLTLSEDGRLNYCTGQYYCTEFRAGACRVLSQLLWDYWRENMDPNEPAPGTALRRKAWKELGRGLANRWFS